MALTSNYSIPPHKIGRVQRAVVRMELLLLDAPRSLSKDGPAASAKELVAAIRDALDLEKA